MTLKLKVTAGATIMTLVLAGCSAKKTAPSSASDNQLTGVAATGAPVVSGKVEIKGANGTVVETTTNNLGAYGASVSNLTSPFLIRVTTPTGEKLISVASGADVKAKKNINVTPITHTIVANVFQQKSADTLFDNFAAESSEFTSTKLDDAKDDFTQKLIDAGVIGASGILSDTSVDLMNGSFVAGSGAGVDKLLDSLDIDIEKGATNIEVKLKDGTPIYTDDITLNTEVVSDQSAGISAVKLQLTALDEIKAFFTSATSTYNSFTTNCSGAVVDNGSACDKDTLHTSVGNLLHTDYKWGGIGKESDSWEMFCSQDASNEIEATTRAECNFVKSENIAFSDITIFKYDALAIGGAEAIVQTNMYVDGVFNETEIEFLKKEGGVWKFYGNQHSRQYWFEAQAVHKTTYPDSGAATDNYAAEVQLFVNGLTGSLGTGIKLKPINKDGSLNAALNTAIGAGTAAGLDLSSETGNSLFIASKKYINYQTNAVSASSCGTCVVNWNANKIDLNDQALAAMDSIQIFELSYTDGTLKTEYITVRRPMKITAATAAGLVPKFTTSNLCTVVPASNVYNFSFPSGQTGDWVSVYVSGQVASVWGSANGNSSARNVSSVTLLNPDAITTPNYANFYLKSMDEFGRKFLRIIDCQ